MEDLIGYARVSTDEQNLALQLDALSRPAASASSGTSAPGRSSTAPSSMRASSSCAGDTLVVWRLDRLGRGLKHLIEAIEQLHAREIGFRSLTEQIDTTTSGGMLTSTSSARWPSSSARSSASAPAPASPPRAPAAARRPPPALTPEKLDAARLMREQKRTMPQIAKALGVSLATLYRHLTLVAA